MKRITLLMAIIIASVYQSAAQNRIWSLQDCMLYAVQNSFNVKRAEIDYRNAKYAHTNAILNQLPSLSAGVGAGSNFGRGVDPATNTYINTTTFSNSLNVNAGVTIFSGLSKMNATRNAKLAKMRGLEERRRVEDETAYNTMMAYIEVVYNQRLLDLIYEKLENSKLNLVKNKRMEELGIRNSTDVAQIEAEVAQEELSLITNHNSLENSIIKLKDFMNYPLDSLIDIKSDIQSIEVVDSTQKLSEIYNAALDFLPESAIGKSKLESQRLNLQTAKWSMAPSLSASGGVGTSYYTNLTIKDAKALSYGEQLKANIGESIGVSMNIPLFNGLYNLTKLKVAKNDYSQAKNDWSEQQRKIQSEIEMAVMDYESAKKEYYQAGKNVAAKELAYKANQRKYDEGMSNISIIELQISANQLLDAKARLAYAHLKYIAYGRQVNYYKGVPYI